MQMGNMWLRNRVAVEEIQRLYWDDGLSMTMISDIFETVDSSVYRFMVNNDIPRRNISESLIGNQNSLGRKISDKTRAKIRIANTGKRHSDETREKMSLIKKLNPPKNLFKEGHIGLRGSDNGRWIEDRSKLKSYDRRNILGSYEYNQWRLSVYERDNFICQMCGDNSGNNLQAHHIKMISKYPSMIYDINNGITLCKKCHESIRCKEEQYIQIFEDMVGNNGI